MGGCYVAEKHPGATADEALKALHARYREAGYTNGEFDDDDWPDGEQQEWADPFEKRWVQVWDEPVKDMATDWMQGWIRQNPPAGVDPDDKWGPWMTFPLASGGWLFFGWVNT